METLGASEADIQAGCLDYLALKRHFFFRLNQAPIPLPDGGFRAMPKHTPRGLPDCILVVKGKFIGLEFKSTHGKMTKDQMLCAQRILRARGDYHIIRSIDDLMKLGL